MGRRQPSGLWTFQGFVYEGLGFRAWGLGFGGVKGFRGLG